MQSERSRGRNKDLKLLRLVTMDDLMRARAFEGGMDSIEGTSLAQRVRVRDARRKLLRGWMDEIQPSAINLKLSVAVNLRGRCLGAWRPGLH
jgi:hypothetical protein